MLHSQCPLSIVKNRFIAPKTNCVKLFSEGVLGYSRKCDDMCVAYLGCCNH